MATFGITPVTGYPLPPSDSFPNFIQFQADGVDLGGPDADTVDFASGLTATRGTGESSGVVTVVGAGGGTLEVEQDGTPIVAEAAVLNFTGAGVTVTANSGGAAIIDIPGGGNGPITWRSSSGSTTLVLADAENGIAMTAGGSVHVPPHSSVAFPDGTSILVLQDSPGTCDIVEDAGVTINTRDAFLPICAGQFALLTIVQRGLDNWIAAGDLELA